MIEVLGWIVGFFAALIIGVRVIIKAGEEKRRYNEIKEDLEMIKTSLPQFMTRQEHDQLQRQCWDQRDKLQDGKIHQTTMLINDRLNDINSTLCYFMGQMKIKPPEFTGFNRRKTDKQGLFDE